MAEQVGREERVRLDLGRQVRAGLLPDPPIPGEPATEANSLSKSAAVGGDDGRSAAGLSWRSCDTVPPKLCACWLIRVWHPITCGVAPAGCFDPGRSTGALEASATGGVGALWSTVGTPNRAGPDHPGRPAYRPRSFPIRLAVHPLEVGAQSLPTSPDQPSPNRARIVPRPGAGSRQPFGNRLITARCAVS